MIANLNPMPHSPRICILGAGPSGLAMARALLEAGLNNFVIYDKQKEVGGNWAESDRSGHSSVYEGVRSISSKRHMAFTDFPFPPDTPAYPTQHDLLAYLKRFVAVYQLDPYLQLSTEVRCVAPEHEGSFQRWRVTLASGESSSFDAICICNGHHSEPLLPQLPGSFTGKLIHSHDFRNSFAFAEHRALVLGGGNSAADIAADLARRCGHVVLSLRRAYHVVPRYLFGLPSDDFHARMHWLPRPLLARIAPMLFRFAHGPAIRHLPRPDHPLFASHPLIHSELPHLIASGAIRLRGPIRNIEGKTITFSDGSEQEFDLLVACTGYRITFPFLQVEPALLPPQTQLTLRIVQPDLPGLFFIGLFQPNGSIWPLADLQAKLVAAHLRSGEPLPAVADTLDNASRYIPSPRHALEVDFFHYRRVLQRALRQFASTPSRAT